MTGTDARVGVVVDSGAMLLFFCGGPKSLEKLTHWIHVPAVAGGETFQATDGVATATGTVDATEASGTISVSGVSYPWSATVSATGSIAGLYAVTVPGEGQADLIVQEAPSGAATGQGAFKSTAGALSQVTPLMPIALRNGGISIEVAFGGSLHTEVVTPATP